MSRAFRRSSVGLAPLLAWGLACATAVPDDHYRARIRRTDGGIPHILAPDEAGMAFGALYAMAQDDVCILADQYLTLGARRASFHGPGEGDANVRSDFLYQLFIDRGDAAEPLPPEVEAVFEGAAAGYDHYLAETGVDALPDERCRGAAWVRPIRAIDVKRVSRFDWAFAYMLPLLTAAAPPPVTAASPEGPPDERRIAARLEAWRMGPKQGGSNAIAIGREHAKGARALLLANPHMPWNEPYQRFYPMHQTVPGELDVLGATLIGRPRVGFGHNGRVAWTSTVSPARRTIFYQLELVPGDPTSYRFDGEPHRMRAETVRVQVRLPDGSVEERTHVFYSTHFGAMLVASEQLPWTAKHAYALRMPDARWRSETSVRDQYAARSVRELEAIHDREQFLPVNLIAADDGGEVLYTTPGPIPNLDDAQLADCARLHGAAFDGSRSACAWGDDPDAAAPGIIGPSRLPTLFRTDYVTNSNDSHWLANPEAPLEGFPAILGTERTPRTLRTRSGLAMVQRSIAAGGVDAAALERMTLANENIAGELLRDDVVAACRERPDALVGAEARVVDLRPACEALAAWDLHADLDSRGAHVFREMLRDANGGAYTRWLPDAFEPVVAFDPEHPVETPRGLAPAAREEALESLARAVATLDDAGIAPDAALGDLQGVVRGGRRIPLHGGPEFEGIFNKLEARFEGERGYPEVTRSSSSWLLSVAFGDDGPRARGILAYSLSSNPTSPHHSDQTERFSRKEWIEIPYREADVAAAAQSDVVVSAPRAVSE